MLNPRKTVFVLFLVLTIFIGTAYLILWFSTATIKISAPEDSRIFLRQKDGTLKGLGKVPLTYKTRSTDVLLFEARKGLAVTQKGVEPKRRHATEVTISLKDPVEFEAAARGAFIYPLIESSFIYGINANTRSLDARHISDESIEAPRLPLLPFLKQIVWADSKNFIYVTASKGTGVHSSDARLSASNLPYIAAVAPSSTATFLTTSEGLYLAKGLDIKQAPKLASSPSNTISYLFADARYAYYGWLEFEEQEEANGSFRLNRPPEEEEHDPDIRQVVLQIFNHSGDKQHEFNLPVKEQVYRVTVVDEQTVAVLMSDGLRFINLTTKEVRPISFSFGTVVDLVTFDGRLLLLGSSGLWEYNKNQDESYRLASYPNGEEYVPNSLTVLDNSLYFSSSISREELKKSSTTAQSHVYKATLD